jgi:hypothetical protein
VDLGKDRLEVRGADPVPQRIPPAAVLDQVDAFSTGREPIAHTEVATPLGVGSAEHLIYSIRLWAHGDCIGHL